MSKYIVIGFLSVIGSLFAIGAAHPQPKPAPVVAVQGGPQVLCDQFNYMSFPPPQAPGCPGGAQPRPLCMATAASVYQATMRGILYNDCMQEQAIMDALAAAKEDCDQALIDCLNQVPPPGNCYAEHIECIAAAEAAAALALQDLYAQTAAAKAAAQSTYFDNAARCCP